MDQPIAYFEIAGPDSEKLAAFYSTVFGWKPKPGPFPKYYSLHPESGAGLRGGFREEASPERVIYIKVPNLQDSLDAAVAAGAKVVIPPTRVPGVVYFAIFEDPGGNRTGIIE